MNSFLACVDKDIVDDGTSEERISAKNCSISSCSSRFASSSRSLNPSAELSSDRFL